MDKIVDEVKEVWDLGILVIILFGIFEDKDIDVMGVWYDCGIV